jgi:hypothetical protein
LHSGRITSTEKQNFSLSPDGSKYPFVSSSNEIKDTADSGSEVDEKTNTSAPKNKKTAKRCHFAVLKFIIVVFYSCANSV